MSFPPNPITTHRDAWFKVCVAVVVFLIPSEEQIHGLEMRNSQSCFSSPTHFQSWPFHVVCVTPFQGSTTFERGIFGDGPELSIPKELDPSGSGLRPSRLTWEDSQKAGKEGQHHG